VSTRLRPVCPRLELADLRAEQRLRRLIDRVWPKRRPAPADSLTAPTWGLACALHPIRAARGSG